MLIQKTKPGTLRLFERPIQESRTLWNHALAPGWTHQEAEILKIALMKFGFGKWKMIEQ